MSNSELKQLIKRFRRPRVTEATENSQKHSKVLHNFRYSHLKINTDASGLWSSSVPTSNDEGDAQRDSSDLQGDGLLKAV